MHQKVIWLDGTLVPWADAMVHITTHTLHYGSGAFEGIRCYETEQGPSVFRLSEHVDRLLKSFSCFGGALLPWDKETLEQGIIDTIKANGFTNCYIRPLVFFGNESLLLSPKKLSVHCAIIAINMDKYLGKGAISLGISSIKRLSPDSMPIHNKINGFYVNSILAFHDAAERGFDEALLLDQDDNVAEASVANIFFVVNGMLKTPLSAGILPGITRLSIMAIAKKLNLQISEETIPVSMIEQATEAFLCGTASEITVIKNIENRYFENSGEIVPKINSMYQRIIRGEESSFLSWLTVIK